jgi:lipoprotein-anchoring transpeptidase ErfK/SrfK
MLAGCSTTAAPQSTTGRPAHALGAAAAHPTPSPHPTRPAPPKPRRGTGTPVHVTFLETDGQAYGIAMPIIAYFSQKPTDASVFDKVVKVTVNGAPAHGAWYFEHSSQAAQALEAHYRPQHYWPARAVIRVTMPIKGLWAGRGLVFDNNPALSIKTGAAHIVQINGKPGVDKMWVYDGGKLIRTFSISLGAPSTPTYLGTAVDMAKSNPELMTSSPGEPFYSIEVPWSVRVSYDGEFLHDAYWNGELGQANLSHGCTNMAPADAEWYYNWSQIGDPVTWTHTGTSQVLPVWDGYGDWNLSWADYQKGGMLSPRA